MKKKKTEGKNRRYCRRRLIRLFFLTVIFFVGIYFFGFYMGVRTAGKKQAGAGPSAVSASQPQAPEQETSDTSDTEAGLPAEQETPDTSDTEASYPAGQDNSKDELLVLVNPWNPLPEDYQVSLQQLDNGLSVDVRCYSDLQEMMEACRNAGLNPVICSAYRTRDKQESLYQNKVERLVSQGYSREDAIACAGRVVAVPGTSEHQLGLALDIVDSANQKLDESQENTAVQKWLMENSWKYGFILRYPNEKSNITGIIYEPWHYRYVGKAVAEEIFQSGLCLEEYLSEEKK